MIPIYPPTVASVHHQTQSIMGPQTRVEPVPFVNYKSSCSVIIFGSSTGSHTRESTAISGGLFKVFLGKKVEVEEKEAV